jgi:hypothetical protein
MRQFRLVSACVAAVLFAGSASAADNGFYFGGSIGLSDFSLDSALDETFDSEDTGFKIVAGARPLDWLGVEVNYIDLGEVTTKQNTAGLLDYQLKQKGIGASGILFYDIAVFDLFAKAGLVRWDSDLSVTQLSGSIKSSDNSTEFGWGVGFQARLGSLAARLEYERFGTDRERFDDPELISLGVTWTFL